MSRRTASSLAVSSLARFHGASTRGGGFRGPLVQAGTGGGGGAPLTATLPSSPSCNINNNININTNTTHSFSTAASSSSSSSSSSDYKSPLADYFNMIQNNQSSLTGSPSSSSPSSPSSPEIELEIPRLKCGIAEHDIKFKTTSYSRLMLPPYVHTNEYKVILEVAFNLLPLDTPLERQVFHQIVGTRFNVEKNKLKLTCNLFASRIENKRHLCSMLDRIVLGAKRLAAEIEMDGGLGLGLDSEESKVEGEA